MIEGRTLAILITSGSMAQINSYHNNMCDCNLCCTTNSSYTVFTVTWRSKAVAVYNYLLLLAGGHQLQKIVDGFWNPWFSVDFTMDFTKHSLNFSLNIIHILINNWNLVHLWRWIFNFIHFMSFVYRYPMPIFLISDFKMSKDFRKSQCTRFENSWCPLHAYIHEPRSNWKWLAR